MGIQVKVADRIGEILFQTADIEVFRVRLDNGVEIDCNVMDFEFLPDFFPVEVIEYRAA